MSAPYSARAVANTLLTRAKELGINDITPMKLQKLIYYSHGWYLAFLEMPLIKEEIQAWKYGPVIQDIYSEFKDCGMAQIDRLATEISFENGDLELFRPIVDDTDEDAIKILSEVLRVYGKFTSVQLSNMTHSDGTPWSMVANKYKDELPKNIEIPNSLIKECFKSKLKVSGNE